MSIHRRIVLVRSGLCIGVSSTLLKGNDSETWAVHFGDVPSSSRFNPSVEAFARLQQEALRARSLQPFSGMPALRSWDETSERNRQHLVEAARTALDHWRLAEKTVDTFEVHAIVESTED